MTVTLTGPRYRFGSLALDTDLPLPGFDHRRAADDTGPVRFRFRLVAGARPTPDIGRVVLAGRGRRPLTVRRHPDGGYLLSVPDAAPCTLLADGHTLHWHGTGTPTVADAEFLIGTVLPRVATAQNGLVLHAATLAAPAGAVLLCGRSGAGKSTLASAVSAATGWPLLGDDAVALEPGPDGVSAYGFNADVRLRHDPTDSGAKRRVRVDLTVAGPIPARLVIRLLRDRAPTVSGTRAVDHLMRLRGNLLRLDRADAGRDARELALLAGAVRHLSVVDLRHPGTPEAVAGTAERIVRLAAGR